MHYLYLFVISFLFASIYMYVHPALAYVGPGPGLSMVGSFFTLIAGIAIALFFVLLYPIRLMIKKRKAAKIDTATKAQDK